MGLALGKSGGVYCLHVRCANCVRDSQMTVFVPSGCDPIEADEFTSSAELGALRYQCSRCEGVVGQIVGVVAGGSL